MADLFVSKVRIDPCSRVEVQREVLTLILRKSAEINMDITESTGLC